MQLVEALGDVVRARRKALGFSQEKLAELAGAHPNFVGFVERGQQAMSVASLELFAAALKVRPSELLAEAEALLEAG